jgi:hypothetical protein
MLLVQNRDIGTRAKNVHFLYDIISVLVHTSPVQCIIKRYLKELENPLKRQFIVILYKVRNRFLIPWHKYKYIPVNWFYR